jgi:micrococcal nuclease
VEKLWEYQIKVLRIIDGDTIDAQVDLGFHTHRNIRVRLYGIDTPEIRTRDPEEKKLGLAAMVFLSRLLSKADKIIMKSHGIGKFGRCLGEIFIEINDDLEPINDYLIEAGLAKEYYGGKRK